MSSLSNIPKQSYFSAQLQSPIEAAQTDDIILTSVPTYVPSGETVYFNFLDAGRVETISATGWDSGTKELSGVVRAVATYTGETATAYAHGAGVTVVLSDDWKYFEAVQTAVNSKFDTAGGTITGPTSFSGASTTFRIPNLTTAQKNAIASPANGMLVYDTDAGEFQYYDGGAWLSVGTSAVPNASEAVAGIVEEATVAELLAGTNTGGTGAKLFATPGKLAGAIQESKFIYATTGGAADAYTLTLAPPITAYTTGQLFFAKVHATNTGSSTINVDAVGLLTIKKNNDRNLEAGDLEAGQFALFGYDGTNMQLLSVTGTGLTTAQVNTLVGGETTDADSLHTHELYNLLNQTLGIDRWNYNLLDLNDRTATSGFTETTFTAGTVTEYPVVLDITTPGTSGQGAKVATSNVASNTLSNMWTLDSSKFFQCIFSNNTSQDFFGGVGGSVTIPGANGTSTTKHIGFFIEDGTIWASNADGTTQTRTDVSAGITLTTANTFSWEFISGTNIVFKINGTTVATHSTNLPGVNSTDFEFIFGLATATASARTVKIFRRVNFFLSQT